LVCLTSCGFWSRGLAFNSACQQSKGGADHSKPV
jgi:hypothetical protein